MVDYMPDINLRRHTGLELCPRSKRFTRINRLLAGASSVAAPAGLTRVAARRVDESLVREDQEAQRKDRLKTPRLEDRDNYQQYKNRGRQHKLPARAANKPLPGLPRGDYTQKYVRTALTQQALSGMGNVVLQVLRGAQ